MQRCRKSSEFARIAAAVAIAWILSVPAAHAGDVAIADLQATMRSLGFLDSLQHRSVVSIGVVYSANAHDGKNAASQAANAFSAMPGPGSSAIHANVVTVDELLQNSPHFDALYLMPGVAASGSQIADFVRRQHVVSISSDPACLDAKYCVLLVEAGSNVNIVLDTAMALAADAHFSSVFTMMVKRK
jgi:hypothetical protein